MDTLFERYKNLLVLVVVLLVQFIALAMQVRTPLANGSDGKSVHLLRYWVTALVAPPEKAVVHTGSGVRGFWGSYLDLRHTRNENQELREEVNRLRLEQAGLLEDARQGQRLQALLQFREHYIYQTVPAQVIGTGGTDQSRVLTIDKGSRDGLRTDQPVITPDGIVGKVRDVFPHTAQILEINDQTSGAGVLLEKTRLRGVLRGNSYGQPQVIDILPDERIKQGEAVLTSGGDGIFPRGLPVGTVEKVVADSEREPYEDIVVRPAANLQHLEEVLIVTGVGEELPARAREDLARSQAVGAAEGEKQRAADILADRLPTIIDPNDPEQAAASEQKPTGGEEVGRPIQPPQALHADRYTPNATPPASQLTPGKASVTTASVRPVPTAPASAAPAAAQPRVKKPAHVDEEDQGNGLDQPAGAGGADTPGAAAKATPKEGTSAASAATATPRKANSAPPAAPAGTAAASRPNTTATGPGAPDTASARAPHGVPGAVKQPARVSQAQGDGARTGGTRTNESTTSYVEPKWVGRRVASQEQPQ